MWESFVSSFIFDTLLFRRREVQMRQSFRYKDQTDYTLYLKCCIPVSFVLSSFIDMERKGSEFVCLSPFTRERTPSFFAVDHRHVYKDFSSGKAGNVISFLIEVQGMSPHTAVQYLVGVTGFHFIPLQYRRQRPKRRRTRRRGI